MRPLLGSVLGLLVSAVMVNGCRTEGQEKQTAPATTAVDRVVGVAYRCDLTVATFEGGTNRVSTRPSEGEWCINKEQIMSPREAILDRKNVRAIVTVRTPPGGSYTIETTNLSVQVGDTWPK